LSTKITKGSKELPFDQTRLENYVDGLFVGLADQDGVPLDVETFTEDLISSIQRREAYSANAISKQITLNALDEMTMEAPAWDKVAVRNEVQRLYKEASHNRVYDSKEKYGSFRDLLLKLIPVGIYDPQLVVKYSEQELKQIEDMIDPSKDDLFTTAGLMTLKDRYLTTDHGGNLYELPQERFAIIAMTLMQDEPKEQRMFLVGEAYWALSNLYMTVATPTLSNAGMDFGQLSSCFIDTVEDSIEGIFNSNTDVARLSKNGGGIGVYLGKVRALGSSIKGFKNASSGVVPWIKQLNNTAVSVDQLGQRKGAIAVYLDVWHKDTPAFLELRLNNGDERKRAHDIFLGASIPDIFMEAVRNREDFYLFDPHEVEEVMGFRLEDYYDEEKGSGTFRTKYQECVDNPELSRKTVRAIDIMKKMMKSQLETGTPFMFYRDTVNRAHPLKRYHADGTAKTAVYSSNLCTEIMQSMSPSDLIEERIEVINGEEVIVQIRRAGDFVVCNLSSVNLGKAVPDNVLERLIKIQVRMLDNVIELNKGRLEVLQAEATNARYRAIGLGTFGWAHLLAKKGIMWESQEAVDYADELYENIAFLTIKASMELAKEKGAFPMFEGSEWATGEYFERRGYTGKWEELADDVKEYGIRNAHLMAVAPNGSTSIIAGSTATIDPIFKKIYTEEKQNIKIPVTAPDLNPETTWFYKSAYLIDQRWSVKQNAARSKHVDQGVSFNLYVPNTIKAAELLELHLEIHDSEIKTSYYIRSTSQAVIDDCESCQ
jgi:ribonucleoside-diphosphate reductase alpha chain